MLKYDIPPQTQFQFYVAMAKKCEVLKALVSGSHAAIFQEAEEGFRDKAETALSLMESTIEG